LLALSIALVVADPASATSAGRWGGFLAVTTDYAYRGVSQTHGDPAFQGDLHYDAGNGSYFGIWSSTVKPALDMNTTLEVDLYAGHSWLISSESPDWRLKLTAIHYEYLDTPWQGPRDYDEVIGALVYRDRVFLSVAWSPNAWRYTTTPGDARHAAASYELTTHQAFAGNWYVAAGAGYYDLSQFAASGYWYWNTGIGYARSHYQLDLSTFGLDSTDDAYLYWNAQRAHWALTLTWQFR
jgi:uncharacterized protein (TIGR02001 family)